MSTQRVPDGFTPELCSRCEGSREEMKGKKCRGCNGKGFVDVRKPAARCAYCAGTGNNPDMSPCAICGGSGWANTWRG